MREHWGDSADEALNCVEATLDEWWGGGSREMTDDSRQHAMSALYFVRKRMTEVRAERDELKQAGAAILLSKVSAMPEDLAEGTRERDVLRERVWQLEQADRVLRQDGGRMEDQLDLARDRLATAEFERDQARRLARWLYRNGGRQVLDVNGGGDTSEWPWLQEEGDGG